jgi:uncharacterized protein (DUF736 family)
MGKEQKVGALWIKMSSQGEYLSGELDVKALREIVPHDVDTLHVVAFLTRAEAKKNPKEPDYRILKARPKSETPPQASPQSEEDPIAF